MQDDGVDAVVRGSQAALLVMGALMLFLSFVAAYYGWKMTGSPGPAMSNMALWSIMVGPIAAISGTIFVSYGIGYFTGRR